MDKKEQIEKPLDRMIILLDKMHDIVDKNKALSQPKEEPKKEVDLEELREIIENCIGHSDLNVLPEMDLDLNKETTELANDIIKSILPHLQKPVESEWISVEDRLPEIEDYYRVKFTDGTEDEKPFRNRPKRNILGFMTENIVTHWMPLPQPPKNNSNN